MADITQTIQTTAYEIGKVVYSITSQIIKLLPEIFGKSETLTDASATALGDPSLSRGLSFLFVGVSFILAYIFLKKASGGMKNILMIAGLVSILSLGVYFFVGKPF